MRVHSQTDIVQWREEMSFASEVSSINAVEKMNGQSGSQISGKRIQRTQSALIISDDIQQEEKELKLEQEQIISP